MARFILLLLLGYIQTDFSGTSRCLIEEQRIPTSQDGPTNLQCYFIKSIENGLTCSWNPGKHHTETSLYKLILYCATKNITEPFSNITGTNYTVPRDKLYISCSVTIRLETEDGQSRSRDISLIPDDAVKPELPSKITYRKSSGELNLKWPTLDKLHYELHYKEHGTPNWNSITDIQSGKTQARGLKPLAAYEFRMCCRSNSSRCLCSVIYHVPPELKEMPQIHLPIHTIQEQNGKRMITLGWENPTGAVNGSIDGYNVTIERLPSNEKDKWAFTSVNRECTVILSGASFKVQVLAYNAAGTSPRSEITIPPFTQMSLRTQLNATVKGNNTIFIDWITIKNNNNKTINDRKQKFILDWHQVTGNKTLNIQSQKVNRKKTSHTIKGPFEPKQRYRIMLHQRGRKRNQLNDSETTVGMVDIYILEGTPKRSPDNLRVANITQNTAVLNWDKIPEEECEGFLQGYKIIYYLHTASFKSPLKSISVNSSTTSLVLTKLSRKATYAVQALGFTNAGEGVKSPVMSFSTEAFGAGEITKIAVGVSFAVICGVFLLVWIFSVIVNRLKENIWPNIPNPKNSYAIEIIRKDPSVPNLNNELLNLNTNAPAEEAEEELEILHPIEEVLSTPTCQELQRDEQNNLLRDPEQGSRNSLNRKPTAVVQMTDYTTMEQFQQIMPNFANNGPGGTFVQPDQSEGKRECNSQCQQSDFPVPDYVKQPVHPAFKQMDTKTSRNQVECVKHLKDSETLNLLNSLNLKQKPSGEQCEHLFSQAV